MSAEREPWCEALREADDLLRRLSEWDALNMPEGSEVAAPWGDWPNYWKREVERVRACIAEAGQ